ncbi:MAG: hypothetical protein IT423_09685 [Pirellulaceae bacterium]|nr:hypothetical protein [Pirellulaceae bacterium]
MSAPMHVVHPPRLKVPMASRIAFAPIVADDQLSAELEQALVAQMPAQRADLQLLTAKDLVAASPVRLASTAPLTGDLTALLAARQAKAELLLMGEVVQNDLGQLQGQPNNLPPEAAQFNANNASFLAPAAVKRPERLAIAWRVLDVPTGRVIGNQTLAIDRIQADRQYPDLPFAFPMPRERVVAASARQTWQSVAPYIEKEDAILALPWLQPGASQIRRGNGYARIGRWEQAETEWTIAATRHPWSNTAKHNLALAQAAREDFESAKYTLGTMGPLRMRKRQSETLVWIDQRHRWHHEALGLPPPEGGWAFPDPVLEAERPLATSVAPDPEDAPWWTAIPGTKPPGWTWRQWLFQPWAL